MANFKMTGLDELMEQINNIGGDVEEIAKKAINEAIPTMEASIKSSAAQAANKGYSKGALVSGIKAKKARTNEYGVFASVNIEGTDSNGIRNAEKAAYMEYGTSKQSPSPFMSKGVKAAEASCLSTMERVVEQELNKYSE